MAQPQRHPAPLTREQEKARYQAYQRAGQALAAGSGGLISVPTHPDVLQVEGGAFIEGMIWVSEREMWPELVEIERKPGILG